MFCFRHTLPAKCCDSLGLCHILVLCCLFLLLFLISVLCQLLLLPRPTVPAPVVWPEAYAPANRLLQRLHRWQRPNGPAMCAAPGLLNSVRASCGAPSFRSSLLAQSWMRSLMGCQCESLGGANGTGWFSVGANGICAAHDVVSRHRRRHLLRHCSAGPHRQV